MIKSSHGSHKGRVICKMRKNSMDESSPVFNNLPPKRKITSIGAPANADDTSFDIAETNDLSHLSPAEVEMEKELLDSYEQLMRDEPREIAIDIDSLVKRDEPTAPVLADCVDPSTVPLRYLLEQARASAKTDDDDIPPELLEDQKEL